MEWRWDNVTRGQLDNEHRHLGVSFTVELYLARTYRWAIYPSGLTDRAANAAVVSGSGAFRKAYNEAKVAIEQWLAAHPQESSNAAYSTS